MVNFLVPTAVVLATLTALLLFQTYIGAYLTLLLFVRKPKDEPRAVPDERLPTVTILIPAHNEQLVIGARIRNLLAQDYPSDKMNIVVASDCSTDSTDELVTGFTDPRVRLMRMEKRRGKLGIIDHVVKQLTSEVIVITDANVVCALDAVRRIAEPFDDPTVGAVGGQLTLKPPADGKNVELESSYRRYEITLKRLMSRLGIVIGIYGGFYSFRRELFKPIVGDRPPCHDDVILPLEVMNQGKRVLFAENACAYEETTSTIRGEFLRRVRMTAYNLNSLAPTLSLSFRAGPAAGYVAVSYKVLRWLSPFLLGILFLFALALSPLFVTFRIVAALYLLGLLLSLTGWLFDRAGRRLPVATALFHFAMMNVASYVGLKGWIRGAKQWWTPRSI